MKRPRKAGVAQQSQSSPCGADTLPRLCMSCVAVHGCLGDAFWLRNAPDETVNSNVMVLYVQPIFRFRPFPVPSQHTTYFTKPRDPSDTTLEATATTSCRLALAAVLNFMACASCLSPSLLSRPAPQTKI